MPIRVLIVDDSAVVRSVLTEILSSDSGIEVVGGAADPFIAREMIKELKPDVLTLDIEMPRMDGLTFLENLMRLHPLPVVMVSTLTEAGAQATLDALQIGAVDFVAKPKMLVSSRLREYASELIEKVKSASQARVRDRNTIRVPAVNARPGTKAPAATTTAPPPGRHRYRINDRLIAIGASAGGTEAIRVVLDTMPADAPGIVITQHIPAAFSGPFAERLNRTSPLTVSEARDGQIILPGHAYVAPGGFHLRVVRNGQRWQCSVAHGELVSRHMPSVDVLFQSVAENVGRCAVGVILTGMGHDGAQGLLQMREAGAPTMAQDQASSVVWGMPGSAVKAGGVQEILPLEAVASRILALVARN